MSGSSSDAVRNPTMDPAAPVIPEWLHDGKIFAIAVKEGTRLALDAWYNQVAEVVRQWPASQPLLLLHDFSQTNASMTPYARARSQELMELRPELGGRSAVILARTPFWSLVQLLLRSQRSGLRARQVFFSRQEGLTWLERALVK